MRTHPLIEAFNAGEFGARMVARVSFDKYRNAGSVCENILPLPQGGFTRRPGFRHIASCISASVRSWLIPFEFSTTQAYILELGEQTMRFFRNQGVISADNTDAAITNGAFGSNITSWTARNAGTGAIAWDGTHFDMDLTGAGTGNEARAYQAVTTTALNTEHVIAFKVVGDPGDEITVRVGSTIGGSEFLADAKKEIGWHTISFTPTVSPFNLEFENSKSKTISIDDVSVIDDTAVSIPTPWSEADLPNLSYAQSADVIYFAIGGTTRVYRLERHAHAAWSLENVLWEDGPYLALNTTTTTLTLSAVTGNGITVTASAVKGINDDQGFRALDVGRLIRWKDGASHWTWLQITAVTDTTHVTADIKGPDASATTATKNWRLGEWNDVDGWPSVVGFIQQRLGLAATSKDPQKFWLSKSADIETQADQDVNGAVQDDSAIPYRFAALKVNTILWLAMRKKPVIGTVGGEWTLRSESNAFLTPSDIAADLDSSAGVAKIAPVEARNRLLYVQAARRKIQEFADILQPSGVSGYDSFDLSVLNDRVLTGGAVQIAYGKEPDSILWCARADGQVPTLTYQPDQSVIGWARQIMGGSYQGGDAVVESVAAIPGNAGSGQFKDSTGRHEIWAVVKRTINGATTRSVECMEKVYNGDEDLQEEAFYVDSGLTLDNPITITGITNEVPAVVTAASHGFSNGATVRIVRVKGMTEINGKSFTVANVTANTFELQDLDAVDFDTTTYGTYITGGEVRQRVSTVSGLDHLEGETVSVTGDGSVQTDKTVVAGAITLDNPASLVHVGLAYESRWESLKLAYGAAGGTAVGKPKNIPELTALLLETAEGALSVCMKDSDGEGTFTQLDLRDAADVDEDPVPLFTGEINLGLSTSYDTDARIVLKGSAPVPFTVLGFGPELETNEQV